MEWEEIKNEVSVLFISSVLASVFSEHLFICKMESKWEVCRSALFSMPALDLPSAACAGEAGEVVGPERTKRSYFLGLYGQLQGRVPFLCVPPFTKRLKML